HRCAPASDRERRDPRQDRCAAWSGRGRRFQTIATAPPQWPRNAEISLDWSPHQECHPDTTIPTPAVPATSAGPLKAATRRSSAGEKAPSVGTTPSGGGNSAVR